MKPFLVGVTGGSGSGKTFFLKSLINSFEPEQICLISQDNYYKARELQPLDENGVSNFDSPESIDFEEYAKDILLLKSGKKVERREYTYNNPHAKQKVLTFKPAPILIIEGIFVLYHREIADMLDLKLFIDAQEHVKLKRRLLRDKVERGYDFDDVLYRYEKHVAPSYNKYIDPYKYEADIVIPNNKGFDTALEVLINFLMTKIHD